MWGITSYHIHIPQTDVCPGPKQSLNKEPGIYDLPDVKC